MSTAERPVGVTVLAILQILLGILLLLGGFALTIIGFALPEIFPHVLRFAIRPALVGIALLGFASIAFILSYGLWNGKRWAWAAALIFALLGIVLAVVSLFLRPGIGELISLIIDLMIVYYLMQPRLQAYFGRVMASVPR